MSRRSHASRRHDDRPRARWWTSRGRGGPSTLTLTICAFVTTSLTIATTPAAGADTYRRELAVVDAAAIVSGALAGRTKVGRVVQVGLLVGGSPMVHLAHSNGRGAAGAAAVRLGAGAIAYSAWSVCLRRKVDDGVPVGCLLGATLVSSLAVGGALAIDYGWLARRDAAEAPWPVMLAWSGRF